MTTPFFRLLKSEDKEATLALSIAYLRDGTPDPATVFSLDPAKFAKVPNSPFAYWVDDEIRELFTKFPPFESEGRTVRVGLQTSDDFRFLRAWWEVPAENRLDAVNGPDWYENLPAFQAWCRKRTHEGKYWAPFAKGGEYSPYYADIHLVVNWKDEGEEIKNFADPKTGKTFSRPQNTDFYFRPGVTWPNRPTGRGAFSLVPAGGCFGHNGSMIFSNEYIDSLFLTEYCNSELFLGMLHLLISRGTGESSQTLTYEVGLIKSIPIPFVNKDEKLEYSKVALKGWADKVDIENEESVFFSFGKGRDQAITHKRVQSIPDRVYCSLRDNLGLPPGKDLRYQKTEEIDHLYGIAIGRFDVRIAYDSSQVQSLTDPFSPLPVCPPAILVGTDGLPARADNIASEAWLQARPNAISLPPEPVCSQKICAEDYPIDIPWGGILVDDPEDNRDILARIRAALVFLYGVEAEAKERELCAELGVRDLRDYLRKPSLFFDSHLKRYSKSHRKAPIYWPLQTRDGRYTIWLYYPRLTADTLYGCSNILEAKLKLERRKLELARGDLENNQGKIERAKVEELSDFVSALTEMKEEIERIAGLPYNPDLDDGVQITAAPLWSLFRLPSWQKELKTTWEKLENGDYDWAHLAYAIWPNRIQQKCKGDLSLAIAHGLEGVFEQKTKEAKAMVKKRSRKPKTGIESFIKFGEEEE